jgi:hypothetical protein
LFKDAVNPAYTVAMSPPQVIVGKVIAPDMRTGFSEVDTTCDIGFNCTYLTCAWSVIVVTNSDAITANLLEKDGFFIIKTILFNCQK